MRKYRVFLKTELQYGTVILNAVREKNSNKVAYPIILCLPGMGVSMGITVPISSVIIHI